MRHKFSWIVSNRQKVNLFKKMVYVVKEDTKTDIFLMTRMVSIDIGLMEIGKRNVL